MTPNSYRRDLHALARRYGAEVEVTAGNHLRLTLPSGRAVFASYSASDWRAVRNIEAKLRRELGKSAGGLA